MWCVGRFCLSVCVRESARILRLNVVNHVLQVFCQRQVKASHTHVINELSAFHIHQRENQSLKTKVVV